jgi:[protein-PII] uridylyltransferase
VAALVEPVPRDAVVHVVVTRTGEGGWRVDVGARDRPGLLAIVTGVLADAGLDVLHAVVATWDDGGAVQSLDVAAERAPSADALRVAISAAFKSPLEARPNPDAVVTFDDHSSPWYTICEIEAPERIGLLHELATACTAIGASVVAAAAASTGTEALDTFELVSAGDGKLDASERAALVEAVRDGVALDPRRVRSGFVRRKNAPPVAAGSP